MVQTILPDNEIVIEIKAYDSSANSYTAYIKSPKEYNGIFVSAKTIGKCFDDLTVAIRALEQYRKNTTEPKKSLGEQSVVISNSFDDSNDPSYTECRPTHGGGRQKRW